MGSAGGPEMRLDSIPSCVATHLIDGEGKIDSKGLEEFSELTHLSKAGLNYTTVAIMGPQSSGKSTLLNHLFKSKFKMMDADDGRTQTTLGIWLAKSPIIERCTLIMDLEGNDGRERGDDHNFEMKIALFSLVLSDTLLINMWFQDVGRDKAANKPLLRIIFQAMLRLFAPRKTTLLYVIRDMGRTSLEKLSATLLKDTLEIWNVIPKPKENKDAAFDDYFILDVVGLSHYEFAKDKFMQDVDELRKRFSSPSEASLQTKPLVPGIDFVTSTSEIWDRVVSDKALDIPSHKMMIAKVRCEQIDNEKLNGFLANEEWTQLKAAVNTPPVLGFGQNVTSMVDKCLAEYDEEAEFYEEVVKADHREKLKQRLLQEIKPTLGSLMDNLSSQILNDFKSDIDKALNGGQKFREAADWSQVLLQFDNVYEDSRIQQAAAAWTSTKVRDKLVSQISNHVDSLRSMKQNEVTNQIKSNLKGRLTPSLGAILRKPGADMWESLRDLFIRKTEQSSFELQVALEDLGINDTPKEEALEALMSYTRDIVEKSVKKESDKVLQFMQDRFRDILFNDQDSNIPRTWKGNEDVQGIVNTARAECVKIMSALSIMRLENRENDNIQQILSDAFLGEGGVSSLTSNQWEGVEASKTLMSPATCGVAWDHFLKTSGMLINSVNQVIQARKDAEKAAANNQPHQQPPNLFDSIFRTIFPVPALIGDLITGRR